LTFKHKILRIQLPALLWAFLIYILCVSDSEQIKLNAYLLGIPLDKIAHFGIFLIFAFLLIWGIFVKIRIFKFKSASLALLIAIVYGILIEILQHFFTIHRQADIFDVLADTIGAISGVIMFRFFLKNKNLANKL
jgi:VanZ family protein